MKHKNKRLHRIIGVVLATVMTRIHFMAPEE